jgi:pSer/pThr/pTyr-binding forkhead associated (FHA) protein
VAHPDGRHELKDLLSTCGTYVNGTQVQQQGLHHGDVIRFGTAVECTFEATADGLPKAKHPTIWDVATAARHTPKDAKLAQENRMPVPKPATRR